MHVGLISYDVPHRKALALAHSLVYKGHSVSILGFPFIKRRAQEPIFQDRPQPIMNFDLANYLLSTPFDYHLIPGWGAKGLDLFQNISSEFDILITCIAKIIPEEFITGNHIINSHPGILPFNRGVDAFKRAVLNEWPIGITIHKINRFIDAGSVLLIYRIPIYPDDTLPIVATRSFEMEIQLLSNCSVYMSPEIKSYPVDESFPLSKTHISLKEELEVQNIFKDKIEVFVRHSLDNSKISQISTPDFSL